MVSKESNDLLRKLFQRFYSLSGWLWGLWNPSKFYFGCSWRRKLAKPIPVVRFPGKDIIFLLPQLIPLRDRVTDAAFDVASVLDFDAARDLGVPAAPGEEGLVAAQAKKMVLENLVPSQPSANPETLARVAPWTMLHHALMETAEFRFLR